ncbi:MAG: hypothetical protein WCD18_22470 [Thermosynechococcaceae cyanobacterium]
MDELRVALELATEEELHDLTEILFRRKFNPLDYLQRLDPVQVQSRDRHRWLDALETRFRFLAADGLTVLRGESQAITYREVLVRVCRYLKLRFSATLSTTDLEAEIFLHLMQRSWQKMPTTEKEAVVQRIRDALHQSANNPLPLHCHTDPLRLLVEGGSVLALSSVLADVAAGSLVRGQLVLQTARQGLSATALRYTATRSLFAAIGSALWVGFLMDLGWRSIATNYGRIIPIIFTLAQIRLTRSQWAYAG